MNGGLVELQRALTLRMTTRLAYREAFERFEWAVEHEDPDEAVQREVREARQLADQADAQVRTLTGKDPPFATKFT